MKLKNDLRKSGISLENRLLVAVLAITRTTFTIKDMSITTMVTIQRVYFHANVTALRVHKRIALYAVLATRVVIFVYNKVSESVIGVARPFIIVQVTYTRHTVRKVSLFKFLSILRKHFQYVIENIMAVVLFSAKPNPLIIAPLVQVQVILFDFC